MSNNVHVFMYMLTNRITRIDEANVIYMITDKTNVVGMTTDNRESAQEI